MDKVTSAKSHGEEQRTEVYRTIRKLLGEWLIDMEIICQETFHQS